MAPSRPTDSAPAVVRRLAVDQPWAWALFALILFGWYAQFILHISWNAIELIIAQNLIEHGVFATSLDYPSAVTWRPVVPTFVVTALRLLTEDPLTIYRIFCAVAVATLTSCLFLTAKRLAGLFAAHLAAALTLACPAVTTYLVNHPHSYSHWGAMLTLGPAMLVTVRLLRPLAEERHGLFWYTLAGTSWGLAYLSRSELLLFAGCAFLALSWHEWRTGRRWQLLGAWLIPFALIFAAYNGHASAAAKRDGILIRKPVYTFYMSQGWVDPAPWGGADIEADGYQYARQLYGDPLENDENLLKTISRNPAAFQRRLIRNLATFYETYGQPWFFSSTWALGAALMLILVLLGLTPGMTRLPLLLLAAFFGAAHFVLLFHIDHRYLTTTAPPLLLLNACLGGWLVDRAKGFGRPAGRIVSVTLVAWLVWTAWPQIEKIRHHRVRDDRAVIAMRALGDHFRQHVPEPQLTRNRQPHIHFQFPEPNPLRPEDQFLVAYFTRSSWVNGGAEGAFPRGRFYSYRDCEPDFFYLPESRIDDVPGARSRMVARHHNPILGDYYLISAR